MSGGRKERERKAKLQASKETTTTSWVKTVDSRFVAAVQNKNNSSSRRRSKITTKATSGGPTRLAEGFGKGKARDRERQQDTVIGEKDRYDHAKKHRQLATLLTAPESAPTNEQAKDNDEQTDTGCLVGALPLSHSIFRLVVWVWGAYTHTSPISRRLLTCFCGGQSEKRG